MTPEDSAIYSQADVEEAMRVATEVAIREERERCAKIAEGLPVKMGGLAHSYWPEQIAAAIRKQGE